MTLDHRFWVGPLGSLRALPDVAAPVSVPVTRIGGMHRSLGGGVTVDTFARKRAWTWTYDMLHPNQLAYLEALQYGMVPGPLRLIDPHRRNRLPEDQASGGSVTGTSLAYFTDAGSALYYHPLSDVTTADPATLGPAALLRGVQEWNIVAPSSVNFMRTHDPVYTNDLYQVPVRVGEQLKTSMWALGPSSTELLLHTSYFFADGTSTAVTASAGWVPLSLTTWTELTMTWTAPANVIAASMYVATTNTHTLTGASVFTTAWSIAPTEALEPFGQLTHHCEIEDISGGWHMGGGGPYVVADTGEIGYLTQPAGFNSAGLTLYET